MDNENLNKLLQDQRQCNFFLKPIGRAGVPITHRAEIWPEDPIPIHFTDHPPNIINEVEVGDILIGFRTGVSQLIFVAERLAQNGPPEPGIPEQSKIDFPVWLTGKNLTPDYGRFWNDKRLRQFFLKPWLLHAQFIQLHPEIPFSLGALQFGKTVLQIPAAFGKFLVEKIRDFPYPPLQSKIGKNS